MKRNMLVSGLLGGAIGALIYGAASLIAARIPILAKDLLAAGVMFVILLSVSLAEMPLMIFGLRLMVRSPSTPPLALAGTYAVYVVFGSVYAAIFALLTGQTVWGLALVALCAVRIASGWLVK